MQLTPAPRHGRLPRTMRTAAPVSFATAGVAAPVSSTPPHHARPTWFPELRCHADTVPRGDERAKTKPTDFVLRAPHRCVAAHAIPSLTLRVDTILLL